MYLIRIPERDNRENEQRAIVDRVTDDLQD